MADSGHRPVVLQRVSDQGPGPRRNRQPLGQPQRRRAGARQRAEDKRPVAVQPRIGGAEAGGLLAAQRMAADHLQVFVQGGQGGANLLLTAAQVHDHGPRSGLAADLGQQPQYRAHGGGQHHHIGGGHALRQICSAGVDRARFQGRRERRPAAVHGDDVRRPAGRAPGQRERAAHQPQPDDADGQSVIARGVRRAQLSARHGS